MHFLHLRLKNRFKFLFEFFDELGGVLSWCRQISDEPELLVCDQHFQRVYQLVRIHLVKQDLLQILKVALHFVDALWSELVVETARNHFLIDVCKQVEHPQRHVQHSLPVVSTLVCGLHQIAHSEDVVVLHYGVVDHLSCVVLVLVFAGRFVQQRLCLEHRVDHWQLLYYVFDAEPGHRVLHSKGFVRLLVLAKLARYLLLRWRLSEYCVLGIYC